MYQISSFTFIIRYFLYSVFCILLILNCSAQVQNVPQPKSLQKQPTELKKFPKMSVGGGLGFQFGAYGGAVEVTPQVGMYVTPWMQVLVTPQYAFAWSRNYYNSHIWGIGAAVQPCIIKKILVQAGYEFNQYIFNWLDGSPSKKYNFHLAVVGAGYKQYINKNVYFQAMILFNIPLNQHTIQNYSYNYYPFFRVGVFVDL